MEIIKKHQKFVLASTIFFGLAAISFSTNGNEINFLPSKYPIASFIFVSISYILAIMLSKYSSKNIIISLTIFVMLLPFSFVSFNGIKWLYISFLPLFAIGFFIIGLVNLNRLLLHKIK